MPEAFWLTVAKSWDPHYFITRPNLDNVGKIPAITYVVDEISAREWNEFLA
jgi:hypothetical protein